MRTFARVAVPEAAVHEHYEAVAWQHDVRPARQVVPMKAEPQAARMEELADAHLWFRAFRTDP